MAHYSDPLAETSITKFKDQDFNSLRDHCLSRGKWFMDETFPAEASSIGQKLLQGKNLSTLKWMRPKDLSRGPPHFILQGASRFDIQQGRAGNCWFLAALGSLTQNPRCLQKILMDQSFSHQYAGIFHFRFWQCGHWVEVVVDDRLPVMGKECLFVHPRKGNQEFWPCLLEKAYAKLQGSYSHLHYGYLPDALVDLTGGVVTTANLYASPSNLLMMVKMAAKAGSLMTCATPKGPTDGSEVMENGLVSQHAYTVTAAEQIQYRTGWEEIIRLWNPWGNTEWRGRWRDGSREWQETQDPRKKLLYHNKEDGEFWMSCQDFQENFFSLFICNQIPITLDHGLRPHERWCPMIFKNQVILGNSAGEPGRNARYLFSVRESQGGDNVVVSFTVTPQGLKAEEEAFPLSFQVIKVDAQVWLTTFSCLCCCLLVQCQDSSSTGNSTHSRLQTQSCEMVGNQSYSGVGQMYLSRLGPSDAHILPCLDQGLDIDATQLQSLLNQEFLTGPPGDTFSFDECRSIVALMDLKVNGRLDREEFARLWRRLVHCQHVFQNIQKSSGVFLSSDLGKAVENTDFLIGISISSELLDLMTLRYSDSTGRVSFPSLVCFLMRLEAMAKTFHNLSKDGKGLYLTEMEWMNLVMYN
ncbi:PREDICTED: calpain-13 [Chinchilla lanigera]|uniref:calpain-13 n=1 Tax=Chinchilla lanigera TaxID=34839 RepID=UPI0006982CB5|nr:PREDICTED: calpain-13 [Chinchilla lanigera]